MKSSLLVGVLVASSIVGGAPTATAAPALPVDLDGPTELTNVSTAAGVRLGEAANRAAKTQRTGLAIYPLAGLDAPADTFAATVTGTVPTGADLAVDVRGRHPDGQWSEWTEIRPTAPAVLPVAAREVEVRAVLSAPPGVASPTLDALSVTPSRTGGAATSAPRSTATPTGQSYRVFATREGLVGGTTANGHVIVERDHFVALPSRRGLATRGAGEYTVAVCATNGRCAWAPVWDVGPWNTRDDYWNPADVREEWAELPQGRPQAQAAHQDGFNGGLDQFGRRVANPAGIDLADGTFWDGLALTDNAWVTVTYQWTGTAPTGTIQTSGHPLNVRSGPSTATAVVGLAANHAQVRIECQAGGQAIRGTRGTSAVWYRLAADRFVSAAFVRGGEAVPAC